MPSVRRALAEPLEDRRLRAVTVPQTFGGGGFDSVEKVVPLGTGQTVVAGLFSGSVNFAAAGQNSVVLTARGDTDVYVADYDTGGNLLWATQIGGDYHQQAMSRFKKRDVQINQTRFSRYVGRVGGQPRLAGEYVNDLAVDDDGNVYLAGAFRGTIDAGGVSLTANDDFTQSYYDGLLVKIAPGGGVTWAKQIGGAFDDDATSVGVDRTGSVTVGGYFSREADLGRTLPRTPLLRSDGRDGGYVLRFSPAGGLAWAYSFDSNSIGTDERNAVNDLAVTRGGVVYFAGSFASKTDFASGAGKGHVIDADKKTDSVVGMLTRKGKLAWVESTGSDDYDANTSITLDANGNVYTAGYFSDDMDVDPRSDVTRVLTPTVEKDRSHPEFSDLLVSKFAADGTPLWQDQVGGQYVEVVGNLTVGGDGAVYLTGSYFDELDADPGAGRFELESVRTNAGSIKDKNTRFGRNESYDWFVDKFTPNGKFVAARSIGEADDDYAGGTTVLADGSLAVYGRIVDSTVADRDDRQEQAWIYRVSPNLKSL